MRQYKHHRRLITILLAVVLSMALFQPVFAADKAKDAKKSTTTSSTSQSAKQDVTEGVTQSYDADPSVQIGMIVKLKDADKGKSKDAKTTKTDTTVGHTVVPLPSNDIQSMLGVVIPASSATIVLAPQNVTKQQVLVATSGHYNVIVSNQNGPIKVGDYITISAINGIGMKASEAEVEVIGKATNEFTGTSNVLGQVKLKDSIGREKSVALGRVAVDLNISHNPLFQKTVDYVPGFLAKIAVDVANHPVSVARIYLSTAILVITALVTGNMLYSGIRGGMIAVGRNPLSKKSIIRSLIQTVIAGLIIFVAGVLAVYLLLKL